MFLCILGIYTLSKTETRAWLHTGHMPEYIIVVLWLELIVGSYEGISNTVWWEKVELLSGAYVESARIQSVKNHKIKLVGNG